jgi:uncharacterized protein YggE
MKRLVILFVLFLTVVPAFGEETVPQLTVHGQALVEAPADQARLSLAVVSSAATSKEALAHNNAAMKKVTEALAKAGLKSREYHTGRFEIRPEWTSRPPNAAPDWRPAIRGYTVRNSLRITTLNLKKLGAFIEAGTDAGANGVEGLVFDLSDPTLYRTQAIAQATANARRDARELAQAAGVNLEKILSLQLAPTGFAPQRLVATFAKASAVPISPGTVPVRAAVTIVYQISQP